MRGGPSHQSRDGAVRFGEPVRTPKRPNGSARSRSRSASPSGSGFGRGTHFPERVRTRSERRTPESGMCLISDIFGYLLIILPYIIAYITALLKDHMIILLITRFFCASSNTGPMHPSIPTTLHWCHRHRNYQRTLLHSGDSK